MFAESYGPWSVIVGGSDGIGAAFARAAAARGLNMLLIARRPGPLEEMSKELKDEYPEIEVQTLSQDLAQPDAVDRIKEATADLDVGMLIYNVGSETQMRDFLDYEWDFLDERQQRNIIAKTALVHHFGRRMRERGSGGIILMGSLAGFSGSPGFTLYGATKAFGFNLSEGLWYEFKKHNIQLLCAVLGPTATPTMTDNFGQIEGPEGGPPNDAEFVAENAMDHIDQGPIWIADDIQERVDKLRAMTPAERATDTAKWDEEFAKHAVDG